MKLTDQEQVILKAIGSGVAEISRVIRSVGYPKATVKKVLVRLAEKGVVFLHRHDWPQSLKPEQRKLMVKIGRDYFNAVSMRKRNPKSKTKTALKTTGRALKGLAKGALSAGAQILGAGATALNPVRRRTKKKAKKKASKRSASRTVSTAKTAKRRARTASKTTRKNPAAKTRSKFRSVAKARKAPARRATSNPTRKGLRRGYAKARRLSKKSGDTKTMRLAARYMKQKGIKHAPRPKRARKNPSAESIRKTFAGQINGERDLFFPQGTPSGKLAKLGRLVSITTEEGTIKPVHGTAWLCADTKERLHIGSTTNAPLYSGPARSFGKVTKVEYESSKPHLGYRGPIIWFHHMGEKGGTKPTLHADGKGGLKFKGGNYTLTTRGIEH